MTKLDRLGWAADMSFVAFGLRIGVRVSSSDMLDSIYEYLPYGWKPEKSRHVDRLYSIVAGGASANQAIKKFSLVYADVRQIARSLHATDILEIMKSDMELYVAKQSPNRVFVHAGAVGWKGRAIVIPGASMSGKTTLVTALVRAGASYCSDEFAVFDDKGKVRPFARALTSRDSQPPVVSKRRSPKLRTFTDDMPLPVGLVILTRYRPGASWKPRTLTQAQGVLGLLAHTPSAKSKPRKALETLGNALTPAKIFSGMRGEAAQTAFLILRLLDQMLAKTDVLKG
jgi:hypothetical protein